MNGTMSNAMNESMQCGPMHHAPSGMMIPSNQNMPHQEMNVISGPSGLKANLAMNPSMPMNAMNAMYTNVANTRMRNSGYSAANSQQQQQFPATQKRAAAGQQYPMGNGNNIPFNNSSSNAMANSYGPQSQTPQFNANQVGYSCSCLQIYSNPFHLFHLFHLFLSFIETHFKVCRYAKYAI